VADVASEVNERDQRDVAGELRHRSEPGVARIRRTRREEPLHHAELRGCIPMELRARVSARQTERDGERGGDAGSPPSADGPAAPVRAWDASAAVAEVCHVRNS